MSVSPLLLMSTLSETIVWFSKLSFKLNLRVDFNGVVEATLFVILLKSGAFKGGLAIFCILEYEEALTDPTNDCRPVDPF